MSKHYDALVVGGNLAATIATALLAKRGLRGVLVDQGELSTLERRTLFDLIPSDEGSLPMSLVHGELSLREDLRIKVTPAAPLFQVVFPDARLDLSNDRRTLLEEVRRRFPEGHQRIADCLGALDSTDREAGDFIAAAGELPATGFFGKRAASSLARKHQAIGAQLAEAFHLDHDPVSELLIAPLPFLGYFDARSPDQISAFRFARILRRLLAGWWRFEDGRPLRKLFLDVAERKGFQIERTAIESLSLGSNKLEARLSGRRDPLTADFLLDASSDLSGLDALQPKKKDIALLLQSARPKGTLTALALEVDSDVLPPGLCREVLLLNGRRDPARFDSSDPDSEDRPIWLSVDPRGDRTRLYAFHPVSVARAHAERIETLEAVIRARLVRSIPFLEDGQPTPLRIDTHHPLFSPDLDPTFGISGIPCRSGVKNVMLAGPAVLPGLGVEGAYLSALQAADAIDTLANGTKRPKTLAARA